MPKYSDIGRTGHIVEEDEAILNAFIAFLATRRRTRWFNPEVGIDWDLLQFKTITGGRLQLFKSQVINSIKRNEPRIVDVNINIVGIPDDNEIIIDYELKTVFGSTIAYRQRL